MGVFKSCLVGMKIKAMTECQTPLLNGLGFNNGSIGFGRLDSSFLFRAAEWCINNSCKRGFKSFRIIQSR